MYLSDYYLSTVEVTNDAFIQFLNENGNQTPEGDKIIYVDSDNTEIKMDGNRFWIDIVSKEKPIVNVSWYGAILYCNWRSEKENLEKAYKIVNRNNVTCNWSNNGYRLPTEAEWEYAARERGMKKRFGNGKTKANSEEINFDASEEKQHIYSLIGQSRDQAVPVGSFLPNDLGIYDMSGNVWEWCWDWFSSNYYSTSENSRNPTGPSIGNYRVVRGGSWKYGPFYSRITYSSSNSLFNTSIDIGFRIAKSAY